MNFKVITIATSLLIALMTSCNNINENTISKTDYSFGLAISKQIKQELLNENYSDVNSLILNLGSDELSHTVDYLALNSGEKELKKWYNETNKSNCAALVLGVYYAHKGWTLRGNSYASEVKASDALSFIDYQKESLTLLSKIEAKDNLLAEVYSRLIRVHMSLDNTTEQQESFESCIEIDSLKVWAYIHMIEAVQPKWGGTLEQTTNIRSNLPASSLIRHIVDLKLMVDSIVSGYSLTGNDTTDINKQALSLIQNIDSELDKTPQTSIQRFIIYNYIAGIAQEISNEELENKYFSKMEGNYTLYPFGIIE